MAGDVECGFLSGPKSICTPSHTHTHTHITHIPRIAEELAKHGDMARAGVMLERWTDAAQRQVLMDARCPRQ